MQRYPEQSPESVIPEMPQKAQEFIARFKDLELKDAKSSVILAGT
ncbi:MAG: hypothetical protein WAU07_03710 [Microgenomates group bacterium]